MERPLTPDTEALGTKPPTKALLGPFLFVAEDERYEGVDLGPHSHPTPYSDPPT